MIHGGMIPATPSTAAFGALFDSAAGLKSDLAFDSAVILNDFAA
jgi:hypothetical protein